MPCPILISAVVVGYTVGIDRRRYIYCIFITLDLFRSTDLFIFSRLFLCVFSLSLSLVYFQCELHLYLVRHPELSQPPGVVHPEEQDRRSRRFVLAQRSPQAQESLARGESVCPRPRRTVSQSRIE